MAANLDVGGDVPFDRSLWNSLNNGTITALDTSEMTMISGNTALHHLVDETSSRNRYLLISDKEHYRANDDSNCLRLL